MHFQEAGRDTGEEIIAQRDRPSTVDMQQVNLQKFSTPLVRRYIFEFLGLRIPSKTKTSDLCRLRLC